MAKIINFPQKQEIELQNGITLEDLEAAGMNPEDVKWGDIPDWDEREGVKEPVEPETWSLARELIKTLEGYEIVISDLPRMQKEDPKVAEYFDRDGMRASVAKEILGHLGTAHKLWEIPHQVRIMDALYKGIKTAYNTLNYIILDSTNDSLWEMAGEFADTAYDGLEYYTHIKEVKDFIKFQSMSVETFEDTIEEIASRFFNVEGYGVMYTDFEYFDDDLCCLDFMGAHQLDDMLIDAGIDEVNYIHHRLLLKLLIHIKVIRTVDMETAQAIVKSQYKEWLEAEAESV